MRLRLKESHLYQGMEWAKGGWDIFLSFIMWKVRPSPLPEIKISIRGDIIDERIVIIILLFWLLDKRLVKRIKRCHNILFVISYSMLLIECFSLVYNNSQLDGCHGRVPPCLMLLSEIILPWPPFKVTKDSYGSTIWQTAKAMPITIHEMWW